MTDNAPEFQLGEPVSEYKATTCYLGGAVDVAKGDWVALSPETATEPCPTVVPCAKDSWPYGCCMKAGTAGTYISVMTLGITKFTAWGTDIDAGDSVMPRNASRLYGVTAGQGFGKCLTECAACGDTGLMQFGQGGLQ